MSWPAPLARLVEGARAFLHGHLPLEKYFHILPRMPNGEKPSDLVELGFPQVIDLFDGVLIILGLTLLRYIISGLLLEPLGRVAMKHRYYRTAPQPKLDALLR